MSPDPACARCGATLAAADAACPRCLLQLGLDPADSLQVVVTGAGDSGIGPPPSIAELAPHFPQLEIVELIGQGGMGFVYRARQRELDRDVALKLLPASLGRSPDFGERFQREARALAKLSHPGIVSVHDFGRAGEHPYLVMEYVRGANLRAVMHGRSVEPDQALAIVAHICDALQYAHEEGVVHRDIKPENVLVDDKGRVKITDFGLAKMVGAGEVGRLSLTRSHQAVGTPLYMAPEQLERPLEVDHRADLYSLGVVFYELLTGELPMGRFAPPSSRARVDERVDRIVFRSLENQPQARYQSASDVRTDVDAVRREPALPLRAEPAVAGGAERARHGPRGRGSGWAGAAIGCAIVAVLVGGLGLLSMIFLWLAVAPSVVDVTPQPFTRGDQPPAPAPSGDVRVEASPRRTVEHDSACVPIHAAQTVLVGDDRLDRLVEIARGEQLTAAAQLCFVDVAASLPTPAGQADALVALIERQPQLALPTLERIDERVRDVSAEADRRRVVDALTARE